VNSANVWTAVSQELGTLGRDYNVSEMAQANVWLRLGPGLSAAKLLGALHWLTGPLGRCAAAVSLDWPSPVSGHSFAAFPEQLRLTSLQLLVPCWDPVQPNSPLFTVVC